MVDEQNSAWSSLKSAITVYLYCIWYVMVSHTKFQNVDVVVCQCVHEVWYWSPVLTTTTDGTQAKFFCQPVQKRCREKDEKKQKKKGNCKGNCNALQASAKKTTRKDKAFSVARERKNMLTGIWFTYSQPFTLKKTSVDHRRNLAVKRIAIYLLESLYWVQRGFRTLSIIFDEVFCKYI